MTDEFTRGHALILADRIGAEHVHDNRYVFNLLVRHLLEGYYNAYTTPHEGKRRHLPKMTELYAAAEAAFEASSAAGSRKRYGVTDHIDRHARGMIAQVVPHLAALQMATGEILPADIAQDVVERLVAHREDAIRKTRQSGSSFLGGIGLARNTDTKFEKYLLDVPAKALFSALVDAAQPLVDGHDGSPEPLIEARRLVILARNSSYFEEALAEESARLDDLESRIDGSLGFPNLSSHGQHASPSP